MQSWVFVFVMHLCLYLYLHLFLYLNLHLCLYLYLYLFASVCTAMHCIDQSGYAVAKPWVFPGDRSRRSPPSSLQEGHWPRETVIRCHQMSSVVIRCHQMSLEVIRVRWSDVIRLIYFIPGVCGIQQWKVTTIIITGGTLAKKSFQWCHHDVWDYQSTSNAAG